MLQHLFLFAALIVVSFGQQGTRSSELGAAEDYFFGPVEVVAESTTTHPFSWLESPLYSASGQYILFSDVVWEDAEQNTCGMIYRYDIRTESVSEFLRCSGIVGPGATPANLGNLVEGGSNGLHWGWDGEGDLIFAQHAKKRIVRIDVDDVSGGTIAADRVTVVADTYNGSPFNSPNDLHLVDDVLFFTDPPFGLQMRDHSGIYDAFAIATQDSYGIYYIEENGGPQRIASYPIPSNAADTIAAPNGIVVTDSNHIFVPITDFADPHFDVYTSTTGGLPTSVSSARSVDAPFRIEGQFDDLIALADGVTYNSELDIIYAAGPGGVYVHDGTTHQRLAFLRIDDLNSNNVMGGGYLWITAKNRLLRVRITPQVVDNPVPVEVEVPCSGAFAVSSAIASLLAVLLINI